MPPERIFAIAAAVIIAGAMIGGIVLIGGPGEARAERFDGERLGNLSTLARRMTEHYRLNETLPDSLDALSDEVGFERSSTDPSTDPRTGAPYEYERASANSYRLCAEFETEGPHDFRPYALSTFERESRGQHVSPTAVEGAGRHCFDISIYERS